MRGLYHREILSSSHGYCTHFLGNVNVFHGHVQSGRARLGTIELAYPEYTNDESRAATAFVRAHELEILPAKNRRPSLEARVTHINVARSVVNVHVYSDAFGIALTVDVGWDRFSELRLTPGDMVHVSPRQMRVFVQEQREE